MRGPIPGSCRVSYMLSVLHGQKNTLWVKSQPSCHVSHHAIVPVMTRMFCINDQEDGLAGPGSHY